MKTKAPSDVVECIKEKFTLAMGKVIKHDGTVPSFTIINMCNYSMSYIKDVLEGRDPDLSVLFDKVEGKLFHNNDPVWGTRKGTEVTKSGTRICGVLVTQEGIKEITQASTVFIGATKATLALEPLVDSEYIKKCIKDRFRLKEGEVVYIKGDKPFGPYTRIANMRYSKGYVQQVLEGKDPDISDLFELRDGVIYRNQDPFWGQAKGTPFKLAIICGGLIFIMAKGCVDPEPEPDYLEEDPKNPE